MPSSAEAVPAMAPCISSASTPVVGITRPMKPEAMKYRTINTHRLSPPIAKYTNMATIATPQQATPNLTRLTSP
ncbi:hypothetical protein D3C72_2217290 [compost metagenome]